MFFPLIHPNSAQSIGELSIRGLIWANTATQGARSQDGARGLWFRSSSHHPIPQLSGLELTRDRRSSYSDNYLIDVKFGVIVDVEASRAIRQAEVSAADTAYGRLQC
jgi:hypothetical protein